MRLEKRDYKILNVVYRFRFCLGRHIKAFADYSSLGATDRRLKILVEAGFLERKKYIFGVPYLYTLSHKGRKLIGVNKRAETIRLDSITHDIHVLDTAIYFLNKYNISLDDIVTEKELNSLNGFGLRKRYPDFVINQGETQKAVEVELHPKNKNTFENNVKTNYLNYDSQTWITNNPKVRRMLQVLQNAYSNIEIMRLEEVSNYVSK
ncbi:MAG: replication-relaxation family protein [Oscillospiraceae bacterium]|nr:replication-relaxation family protein [Oscillospiraceae bacterium]